MNRSLLLPAMASSLLAWLAFPPVDWSLIVWVAPVGWLSLVLRDELRAKRPYRMIWFAGLVFWLLTLHWIRLPHAMNYLAWAALASYLGVYLPAFVALSRVGVHRLRLPLWLVAPVVWTGLDWLRGNLMTGFLMGSLAHTQTKFPALIQIANLVGEYGVTFLIVLVAASLTQAFFSNSRPLHRFLPLLPAALALAASFLYGAIPRLEKWPPGPRIAIIQGNTLADWKGDPDKQLGIMQEYARLSEEAIELSKKRDGRDVDLILWPETTYRYPLFTIAENFRPPSRQFPESYLRSAELNLAAFVRQTGSAILTGIDRMHLFPTDTGHTHFDKFNSSVLIDQQGKIVGTYDKMHLVIMGEYVPFATWIPMLANLTPMTGFASAGRQPAAFDLDGMVYCPNICYETAVPHLIRRHVSELAAAGTAPEVLVNLTNDAWFWGSSELDMHLSCGIFRAVEMRLPLLIAANGGLSAHVDARGKVQQITPRQQTATLLVDLKQPAKNELTLYARRGDWFAGLCVVCCVVLAVVGYRGPSVAE